MKLKDWLSTNHISQKQFADALCVSNELLTGGLMGKEHPL